MQPSLVEICPSKSPISCSVAVPGSKSYTNRSLIIASQACGRTDLINASDSEDSIALAEGLAKLGVKISSEQKNKLSIESSGGDFFPYQGEINVGPAGTAMRFLTALSASIPGCDLILSGNGRMHQRPIGDLVDGLLELGADLAYLGQIGFPPLAVKGRQLSGGRVKLNGNISSQFLTALMLIAPRFQAGLEIEVIGEQISSSYVAMTIDTMADFGVEVLKDRLGFYSLKGGQQYRSGEYHIDGDASGASYLWAIAAVSGATIKVINLDLNSSQGDLKFPAVLEQMGCQVEYSNNKRNGWIAVKGPAVLRPVDFDMSSMPDSAQTLAVVCACAEGKSVISGLSTLRHKETDRIAAMECELAKAGITAEARGDQLVINGAHPSAALIDTYDDHRMAMAFAVLGARINGMRIKNPSVVRKSFPEYWDILRKIGLGVNQL